MEITLKIKGEDRTFSTHFITGRMFRKTLVMSKSLNKDTIDEKDLDSIVDYAVELFDKQFTRDNFYDGIASDKMISTIVECSNSVVGRSNEALGVSDDPNSLTGPQ